MTDAYLSHIINLTTQNLNFLVTQNIISRSEADAVISKFPPTAERLSDSVSRLGLGNSMPEISTPSMPEVPSVSSGVSGGGRFGVPPPQRRNIPPPPQKQPANPRAKAIYGYNEEGSEPNDLTFHAGDIIEIISETNDDWWTGKINGRQGLVPVNYVEKLPPSSISPSPSLPTRASSYAPPQSPPPSFPSNSYNSAPQAPYSPPPAPSPYQQPVSMYNPPPAYGQKESSAYNPYMQPPMQPVQQQQVVVAEPQEPPKKPSRFGGLGNIMATSAAGGVGFGAGSAVGSGLINAIF
ncbi:hypothetical protein JAAARDRAFT_194450 [Jaapia argillacea MUCL 33604]|uniref:SH3 domain-containing protein n=1 Tax=Jaapia argillacea MUCL 33604 TaxID=933084 RepID=A0A067Q3Y4_9AGAM|nr:hypothetical protein JAAARDRAFT_194450 [Jaapia argillacea MUCL 33604]